MEFYFDEKEKSPPERIFVIGPEVRKALSLKLSQVWFSVTAIADKTGFSEYAIKDSLFY